MMTLDKQCSNCGSYTTTIVKNSHLVKSGERRYTIYPAWISDRAGGLWCHKCYAKKVLHPRHNPKRKGRQLVFKKKQIIMAEPTRIGVCNLCRAVVGFDCKITHIHHEEYDETRLLAHTLELCAACHARQSIALGQLDMKALRAMVDIPAKVARRRAEDRVCIICGSEETYIYNDQPHWYGVRTKQYKCMRCYTTEKTKLKAKKKAEIMRVIEARAE